MQSNGTASVLVISKRHVCSRSPVWWHHSSDHPAGIVPPAGPALHVVVLAPLLHCGKKHTLCSGNGLLWRPADYLHSYTALGAGSLNLKGLISGDKQSADVLKGCGKTKQCPLSFCHEGDQGTTSSTSSWACEQSCTPTSKMPPTPQENATLFRRTALETHLFGYLWAVYIRIIGYIIQISGFRHLNVNTLKLSGTSCYICNINETKRSVLV